MLVCSELNLSRSITVVIAYLMWKKHWKLEVRRRGRLSLVKDSHCDLHLGLGNILIFSFIVIVSIAIVSKGKTWATLYRNSRHARWECEYSFYKTLKVKWTMYFLRILRILILKEYPLNDEICDVCLWHFVPTLLAPTFICYGEIIDRMG